jgi:hypothetical protein
MKIISGGQTGADEAGLEAAIRVGFETGGTAPKNYKTLIGSNYNLKERYKLDESESFNYADRTYENVKNSDGTLRLAYNFSSRGEKCTLKAIRKYTKPYYDIDLSDPIDPTITARWIMGHGIEILNIAGNANRGNNTVIYDECLKYLIEVFNELKRLQNDLF